MKRAQLAELGRFLVAGFSAVGTDWLVYTLCTHAGVPTWLAKTTSFMAGALLSFVVNRAFTFRAKEGGSLQRHAATFVLLYVSTLGLNVAANSLALRMGVPRGFAWVFATGCSTVANFLGMKFFVFSRRSAEGTQCEEST